MKIIGLIGGMSWESTKEYYQIINRTVQDKLGGFNSAKCILYSFNFAEIKSLQDSDDWQSLSKMMVGAAKALQRAGADFIVICANTMHKIADDIEEKARLPVLHIADATAKRIVEKGIKKVGLLGTRFTMQQDFYKKKLEKWGIQAIIPLRNEQQMVDDIIYSELCLGILNPFSKERIKIAIKNLIAEGAQGIILGCTELPLLLKQDDVEVPLFNTTEIHAKAAVDFALIVHTITKK